MSQGFETSYNDMSTAEKTMMRYKYLMSVTADAQGDFARTADSYANSQRRMQTGFDTLKAKLGETLLPIATTVSNAINDLLGLLLYEPPETAFDIASESMTEAASKATQAQGLLGYMDKLYEKYGSAAENTEEWATALEKLKAVMPEVNKYIDAETGSLTASNEQLREYIENSKQAAIEDAKKAALASLNEQYVSAGQAYYTAEINRDIANEQAQAARQSLIDYIRSKPYQQDYTGEGATIQQMLVAAQSLANEYGESQDTIQEWARIYDEQTAAAAKYEAEMGSLEESMRSLETDLNIATAALERLSAAAGAAAGSMGSGGGGYMTSGEYYNWYYSHQGKGFATGLDFVPYEGFYHLHPGERVQTAAEASLARQYGLQQPGMDYGAFGSAMWANAPQIGGNVYLDGRTVGRVISDQQAKTYRNLQRSGWQG
jgi:ABC-type transporter Mla subunit MlaD